MSQANLIEDNILYIYIGPAALCPCPNINSQFIVITGDQGTWVEPLIKLRSDKDSRGEDNIRINHNVIGKSGITKKWYTFNHPFLNGIFAENLIDWCNPACTIKSESVNHITAEKLDTLINNSGFNADRIHLYIAQGNPLLTVKRAETMLENCIAVDLSLHPLTPIWQQQIEQFLKTKSFETSPYSNEFWEKKQHRPERISPSMQPSQSELFFNKAYNISLNNINLEDYHQKDKKQNDLELGKLIALGELSLLPQVSISKLISNRIISAFTKISRSLVIQSKNTRLKKINNPQYVSNEIAPYISLGIDSREKQGTLRGKIEGLDASFTIRGWVDSSDFGEGTSQINVVLKEANRLIAVGIVDIERPDLRQIGISHILCGFSIQIDLEDLLSSTDQQDKTIHLCLIESKSGQLIGDRPWEWKLPNKIQKSLIPSLNGHIDGFEGAHKIRGWVDSSAFGKKPSQINVLWKERDRSVGKGTVDRDRPDLARIGLKDTLCGFSIELELFHSYSLIEILDEPITLCLIESNSGHLIGNSPWNITDTVKSNILNEFLVESIEKDQIEILQNYLDQSKNSYFLAKIRQRFLEISAIRCKAGQWNDSIISPIIQSRKTNSSLDYSCNCESATRLELVLLAIIIIIDHIDEEKINKIDISKILKHELNEDLIEKVSTQLKERQFVGLQEWEQTTWNNYFRPLCFALIATLFLQSKHKNNTKIFNLFETLASLAETPFNNKEIAFYLRSILNVQNFHHYDQGYIDLMKNRGDRFNLLLAIYANSLHNVSEQRDIDYLAATIDFAAGAPTTYVHLTKELQRIFPNYIASNPKQSLPRHWVDRLGGLASLETQSIVGQMLELGISKSDVINFHNKMNPIKKLLAELLWCNGNTNCTLDSISLSNRQQKKRWLIVGDKALTQCWMYRVEQKRIQLEQKGCDVRCIDHEELKSWSFTHNVIWADALIVCRLPAMYHVFRAVAFARNCGLKVYAEIDDLLFTPDYPSEYQTYGGSIPLSQYKNLCVDYPLRLGILHYADEIIVSTPVLAEYYKQVAVDKHQPIHILQNLPLEPLLSFSYLYQNEINWITKENNQRIALTSGTLSHKQILKDTVFPAIKKILIKYQAVKLTIIGHVDLPPEFKIFEDRITTTPFTDYKAYLQLLNECTIMLVPLEIHPTTQGKSAIKWMEASLCGVASICSPVRAYTDVTVDGEDVIIAQSSEDWCDSMIRLLDNPKERETIAKQAFTNANALFNTNTGATFWSDKINNRAQNKTIAITRKKILVINVFFAPQSVGGATRVAQDYVKDMSNDSAINYDITVLCVDYSNWQSDLKRTKKNQKGKSQSTYESQLKYDPHSTKELSPTSTTFEEIEKLSENFADYREKIYVDISYWNEARVVRLNIQPKSWDVYEDDVIEAFCEEFFKSEAFDFIQCHCCQIITASPLIVARRMGIAYEVIMHDAWWMSSEQFLVSAAGRLIDPANPLDHFDQEPTDEERDMAIQRRHVLYGILEDAERRVTVSLAFKKVCELAGIVNISVQENKVTSMMLDKADEKAVSIDKNYLYKLCHIGGMSLHKGYQLLRQAVHELPPNLPLQFTIIDHRLISAAEHYSSTWGAYQIDFVASVPMDEMPLFYSNHDVLIAPSIWPESFGLVSREALSAGLWVIASDSGALAEPILKSSQQVGQVIRPNQLQDLINAIIEIPEKMKAKSLHVIKS